MWNEWNSKKNNFDKYKNVHSNLIYGVLSEQIPDISIIIPTYKRSSLLRQSLDSAVNQKGFNRGYEIIVVDNDGEITIETDRLMKEYTQIYQNILYYRNEINIGSFGNWNRCIELCRTEWFCLLHDDDLLTEYYLCKVMPFITTKSDLGLLGVYAKFLDDRPGRQAKTITKDSGLENLFIKLRKGQPIPITLDDNIKRIHILSVALLVNKPKAIEVGGFDDRYYPIGDAVFYSKLASYYQTLFLPERLSVYRIASNDSLSTDTCIKNVENIFHMTEAMIETVYHRKKHKQLPIINAILQENSNNKFNASVDYRPLWKQLGINSFYNKISIKMLAVIYYKLCWGMLLFRPYKLRRERYD